MTPYEQMLHDSGKEEISFYRKKSLSEPGSGRGSYLPLPVDGVEEGDRTEETV